MWLNWTESQCELSPSFCNCHYVMNLQSLTSDISRSSFIHSSGCCLSVHHTGFFCHISLTLHWLQCIAQFDMSWWRVTLYSSHITAGDMCVPWINLVCFVFALMELYVIAAIFQLYRDDQSKLYWWIKQESTADLGQVTVLYHKSSTPFVCKSTKRVRIRSPLVIGYSGVYR
jgi:hypothetical protein